jgi:hypothetical protein
MKLFCIFFATLSSIGAVIAQKLTMPILAVEALWAACGIFLLFLALLFIQNYRKRQPEGDMAEVLRKTRLE